MLRLAILPIQHDDRWRTISLVGGPSLKPCAIQGLTLRIKSHRKHATLVVLVVFFEKFTGVQVAFALAGCDIPMFDDAVLITTYQAMAAPMKCDTLDAMLVAGKLFDQLAVLAGKNTYHFVGATSGQLAAVWTDR